MDNRYKLIISNNNIYKEIELAPDVHRLKVGTSIECDVRLRKELFFEQIELLFVKNNAEWSVHCSDNLYLTVGDVKKFMTRNLTHGDSLEIKYQKSDNFAFLLDFLIDFDDGRKKYERIIDISGAARIMIGSSNSCNIVLGSSYVRGDAVELTRRNTSFLVDARQTTYGVYINGRKITDRDVINDRDFLAISDYSFYYKDNKLWTQIRSDMFLNNLRCVDRATQNSYPKFKRNTRIKTVLCEDDIEILDPPAKPQKPKNNILMSLLPSLGMLLAAGIMASMGGATMLIFSGISTVMAIITSVVGMIQGRQQYEKDIENRIIKYNAYIDNKCRDIERIRNDEEIKLDKIYIGKEENTYNFEMFSSDLFDRETEDEDFLHVSLGRGDVEAAQNIKYKKQERLEIEDELQLQPERICEAYKLIHNAPIVCDFHNSNAIGIIGDENFRYDILKSTVFDICARQFYTDVKLFFIVDNQNKEIANEFRLLPYVNNTIPNIRNIACDEESKKLVFEFIYNELTRREGLKDGKHIHYVIYFYDLYGFASHPISKFVESAAELGVTFVFFAGKRADIPQDCSYLICQTGGKAQLIDTSNAALLKEFEYYRITDETIRSMNALLAPVEAEEISLEGSLTKNIDLFKLLHIFGVDDLDLKTRWGASKVYESMSVPLGVSKTGIVYLDLHDKAHGPHGLVAGTTGSGKSEILQSYILSVATYFHPYEIGFLIIDFKGGGMVNQFKDLPHLLGAITNIDGKEIDRSLKSIKAELQKRQRLFADAEVNHIDKYIQKFKEGKAETPLPHLIIIVDEFAELKAEQPEFMKELISAARIGRSLGVHLILATQKPAGQVDDQIWSNSRFKLCLKVQGPEDSNEVLKSPLAAEIKEPGRAYLQVGNNEIFELFQSAYSGASEKNDSADTKEYKISQLSLSGKRKTVFEQKKFKNNAKGRNQLEAIVSYVSDYCSKFGITKLADICLPPLGDCIDFIPQNSISSDFGSYEVEIGIYDDPENQYQGVYSVALESNNLMIIGSSQSGKTNILQNIIRSLSMKYTPEEATIYIIDFASRVLKNFDKLNHVGGVVCPSEDEKLKNLFKLLHSEIESRKEKLMSVGVSSFAAYKEAGEKDFPLIVLIIDNLTALKEIYFQDDDELINLCREGLTVGISVVIANTLTAGIGYKYFSNFSSRIALFCNDANEYGSLFEHCRERIDNIPGRCIVEVDKKHYECQSYITFKGEKEIDRVRDIKKYISEVNSANRHVIAKRIPLIPASLTKGYMVEQFGNYMEDKFSIVAGLDYATVTPYVLDFASVGLIAVIGREESGRHNWVKYSVDMLDTMYPSMSKVYVIDSISKKLVSLRENDNIAAYSIIAEDAVSIIKEIEMQLKERYDALVSGNEDILDEAELLMLVIDNQDALLAICNNADGLTAYQNIIGRYKNMKVCIVAFADNANIPYSAPDILKNIRDQRNFMYFDDISNMKIFDVPLAMARRFKKPIELGDGYYIKDNECIKLKTSVCPQRGGLA